MSLFKQSGGCFCGNISLDMQLSGPLESYQPRECSCAFCQKHGAGYLSDNQGKLDVNIKEENSLIRLQQGSKQAEFLICKDCGVLTAVCYREKNLVYGAVNYRALANKDLMSNSVKVYPEKLAAAEKTARWTEMWFKNVEIKIK
jgi:hypothetical protein